MKTPNISQQECIEAFGFRPASKAFDASRKLSDDDIQCILKTAILSPNSFGFEPWHFIVVQVKELRELLEPVAWGAPLKLDIASPSRRSN